MKYREVALVAVMALGVVAQKGKTEPAYQSIEALGEALFFDVNLSANRTQACATCHDPDRGFTDGRFTDAGTAVSLGDDGTSLGDRNTPSAAYAAFTPEFHKDKEGNWTGGMFWDGRAATLEDQAGGPPLNPIEMGMADADAVRARLLENQTYAAVIPALFGEDVFETADATYAAMTQAIAAYERTEFFAPFDSKYDRALRGEYEMTRLEELGRTLFFSEQFTNCALCHQLKRSPIDPQETFTNYQYHNIGTPENVTARAVNGVELGSVDKGLWGNPDVQAASEIGKFKVPTLRNVAVTGPYMHNGVFEELRTVVLFYDKYNSKSKVRQINPETGEKWRAPQVMYSLANEELTHGPALDDERVDALVAFLKTLTDARYEHLLD